MNSFFIKLLDYSKEEFTEKPIWKIDFFKTIIPNKDKLEELQRKDSASVENIQIEMKNTRKIKGVFTDNKYRIVKSKVLQCFI